MSLPFSEAFLGDQIQQLISVLWLFLSWLVSLPVAWDLIQLFCGLSFFGLLGFIRLNDEEVRRLPRKKRDKARENLMLLGNYFFVSFGFYVICAIADYLLHNHPLLNAFVDVQQAVPSLTITVGITGLFGLVMLVAPMTYARGIGRRGKGLADIVPMPIRVVLAMTYPLAFNTIVLLSLLPYLQTLYFAGQLILVMTVISYFGTYLLWRSWVCSRIIPWNYTRLFALMGYALSLLGPTAFFIILWLHLPLGYVYVYTLLEGSKLVIVSGTSTGTTTVFTTVTTTAR